MREREKPHEEEEEEEEKKAAYNFSLLPYGNAQTQDFNHCALLSASLFSHRKNEIKREEGKIIPESRHFLSLNMWRRCVWDGREKKSLLSLAKIFVASGNYLVFFLTKRIRMRR